MEKHQYAVGDCVKSLCLMCNEILGHQVISVNKFGRIFRVNCPQCGSTGKFKDSENILEKQSKVKAGLPYDQTRTYHKGQTMTHPKFGPGMVTAVIIPHKIDVLFSDRIRRLIHARYLSRN